MNTENENNQQNQYEENLHIEVDTDVKNNEDIIEEQREIESPQLQVKSSKSLNRIKRLNTKQITILLLILLGIGIGLFFFFKGINDKEKEQNYVRLLKDFITESGKSAIASTYVCEDLREIWNDYIFKDKKYFIRSSGRFTRYSYEGDEYCIDFSEAVNRKIRWNKDNLPSEYEMSYEKARRLYREMNPVPEKYSHIQPYVKQMFKAMEQLHSLSVNPTGNLSTYSRNCTDAIEDYTSALSDLNMESDINFSEIEEDEFSDY